MLSAVHVLILLTLIKALSCSYELLCLSYREVRHAPKVRYCTHTISGVVEGRSECTEPHHPAFPKDLGLLIQ